MKMNVEFESKEELLSFIGMFGTTPITAVIDNEKSGQSSTKEDKPAAEKVKKKKDEQPKVEDKKEESKVDDKTPGVDAEVTGVDQTPIDEPKDAGDPVEVTKEMVRAICSNAIKAGKAEEVKEIVAKYGAEKLPELKEEHYAKAYKDVEALL